MSKTARFVLDPKGIIELLSSPQAVSHAAARARGIQQEWQRNDPRNNPGGHEPPEISVGAAQRDSHGAMVPVFTDDPIWHIIEYGSANNPPYRPATKAAQNAGVRFEGGR